MTFVADESVDAPIVERLRADGHDVAYIAEVTPGIADEAVLDRANSRACPLITADKDFGELVYRLGRASHGVILVRLLDCSSLQRATVVSAAIRTHGAEMRGTFTVISPGLVRVRRGRP